MKRGIVIIILSVLCIAMIAVNVFAAVPGEGINEGYTMPTEEQIKLEQEKAKIAKEYVAAKMRNIAEKKEFRIIRN